jgi:hypothetical protein
MSCEVGAEALRQAVIRQLPAPLQYVKHLIYFLNIQMQHLQHMYEEDETFKTCI